MDKLQTESRNPRTVDIDMISSLEIVQLMNQEDAVAVQSVTPCLPIIAQAIDQVAPKISKGGRMIYMGAGTSGRLGIIDASEIAPTFSMPNNRFVGLIAGGDAAIRVAQEGAEDNQEMGKRDLENIKLTSSDSVIGIASSGRTPYVLGGLAYAKSIGCTTIGLACSSPSEMETCGNIDFVIHPVTGPEVITGSTRLKAGTATKLVLNMLSTGIMLKIGKTYGNLMVDLSVSNFKLRNRAYRIIKSIAGNQMHIIEQDGSVSKSLVEIPDNVVGEEMLDKLLAACSRSVKLAIVVAVTGLTVEESRLELETQMGVLKRVLQEHGR